MLKGLKKLLFNTEMDDVSEEGTVTDIELPKKEPRNIYMETPLAQAEKEEQSNEQRPFTGINVDVEKPKKQEIKTREKEIHKKQKETKTDVSAEYEFRPVLSPIFGNMNESEKNPKEVHDAIHLNKAKTKNPLNTVLSPMYGEYELEQFEQEAKDTIQKRKDKEKSLQVESSLMHDAQNDDEDENGMFSLEDMLSSEEDDDNEPVQISLFGDSTPIKDVAIKEDTVYQEKE